MQKNEKVVIIKFPPKSENSNNLKSIVQATVVQEHTHLIAKSHTKANSGISSTVVPQRGNLVFVFKYHAANTRHHQDGS